MNDDIEVIEETIPKLEAFYSSYNGISSEVDDLLEAMEAFSVSAISSEGLESKSQELQELEGAVNQRRSKLEALLASCDLLETPFDQSRFEKDVSELQEKMSLCDQVRSIDTQEYMSKMQLCNLCIMFIFFLVFCPSQTATGKKADLKALGKKVHPMEDLFHQFRAWLESANSALDKLSPAATDQPEREQQLQQAKVDSLPTPLVSCFLFFFVSSLGCCRRCGEP